MNLTKPIAAKPRLFLKWNLKHRNSLQIRRSGRDVTPPLVFGTVWANGILKMREYDYEGWHPTFYIAREFYGVWGDYDVTINIDKTCCHGTGVLVNANEIGWGYDTPGSWIKTNHKGINGAGILQAPIFMILFGLPTRVQTSYAKKFLTVQLLHVLFIITKPIIQKTIRPGKGFVCCGNGIAIHWAILVSILTPMQYSFIQGGDGGMEYPMATLLIGPGLGTAFHEWLHSWY